MVSLKAALFESLEHRGNAAIPVSRPRKRRRLVDTDRHSQPRPQEGADDRDLQQHHHEDLLASLSDRAELYDALAAGRAVDSKQRFLVDFESKTAAALTSEQASLQPQPQLNADLLVFDSKRNRWSWSAPDGGSDGGDLGLLESPSTSRPAASSPSQQPQQPRQLLPTLEQRLHAARRRVSGHGGRPLPRDPASESLAEALMEGLSRAAESLCAAAAASTAVTTATVDGTRSNDSSNENKQLRSPAPSLLYRGPPEVERTTHGQSAGVQIAPPSILLGAAVPHSSARPSKDPESRSLPIPPAAVAAAPAVASSHAPVVSPAAVTPLASSYRTQLLQYYWNHYQSMARLGYQVPAADQIQSMVDYQLAFGATGGSGQLPPLHHHHHHHQQQQQQQAPTYHDPYQPLPQMPASTPSQTEQQLLADVHVFLSQLSSDR